MTETVLAERPAARILLVDGQGRLLLFRFVPEDDRGPFWCTPGGAVDPGESYEAAARRELFEETGLDMECGPQVAQRDIEFVTLEGVPVHGDERYFLVRVDSLEVATHGHTELERRVMQEWRWFSLAEVAAYHEPIFPVDLVAMVEELTSH